MDYAERIEARDGSIFSILTAMTAEDRRSFLDIQNVVRSYYPGYIYLEVGSDLGGSIIAPLVDDRCSKIISIDLRTPSQLDERGRYFDFPDNSAARMCDELRKAGVPESALARMTTFDADASSITLAQIGSRAHFAFIDAEHTNRAVFRDFLSVRKLMHPDCIVAFHDANLIFDGLLNIEEMLRYEGGNFTAIYAPDTVFVLAFGGLVERVRAAFDGRRVDRESFVVQSRQALNLEIARNTAGV